MDYCIKHITDEEDIRGIAAIIKNQGFPRLVTLQLGYDKLTGRLTDERLSELRNAGIHGMVEMYESAWIRREKGKAEGETRYAEILKENHDMLVQANTRLIEQPEKEGEAIFSEILKNESDEKFEAWRTIVQTVQWMRLTEGNIYIDNTKELVKQEEERRNVHFQCNVAI